MKQKKAGVKKVDSTNGREYLIDKNGVTELMHTICNEDFEEAARLLDEETPTNVLDNFDRTALDIILMRFQDGDIINISLVEKLLEKGAKCSDFSSKDIKISISSGLLKIVEINPGLTQNYWMHE